MIDSSRLIKGAADTLFLIRILFLLLLTYLPLPLSCSILRIAIQSLIKRISIGKPPPMKKRISNLFCSTATHELSESGSGKETEERKDNETESNYCPSSTLLLCQIYIVFKWHFRKPFSNSTNANVTHVPFRFLTIYCRVGRSKNFVTFKVRIICNKFTNIVAK